MTTKPPSTMTPKKVFTSAELTITAGAAPTAIPHGLGAAPNFIVNRLACKTNEIGYTAGENVFINNGINAAGSNNQGVSVWADATNIYYRYGNATNSIVIIDDSTGALNAITNANWRLIITVGIFE